MPHSDVTRGAAMRDRYGLQSRILLHTLAEHDQMAFSYTEDD